MAVKDLVSGVLAESITTSTTNILVTIAQSIGASGIQAFFPTPPFYITIMPKSPIVGVANRLDSEIIRVTAVGHDQVGNAALTGVRGQRDTTAKAFSAGDIVTVGVYTDDAVLLGGTGTTETTTPWIDHDMLVLNSFPALGVVGMISIKAVNEWDTASEGEVVKFSDVKMGTKTLLFEYDPLNCLKNSSGTCLYTHTNANVKFLEVELTVVASSGALWAKATNGNPLNNAVMYAVKTLEPKSYNAYGGSTFKAIYDVSGMTIGDSFFVNPQFGVYGTSSMYINGGGTEGGLLVKALGK